eukprot:s54_g4.t1
MLQAQQSLNSLHDSQMSRLRQSWAPVGKLHFESGMTTVPGEPFCKTPEHGGTLAPEQCSLCMGVEAGKKGPECNCEVNCAEDHKQMGEIAGGKKDRKQEDCVATEFPCPKAVLADGRCIDAKTNEVTHFFCCDESWGPNVPPDKLAAAVCSDIKEDLSAADDGLKHGKIWEDLGAVGC